MSKKKLLQKFRVPLGFLFAAIFLIFARPTLPTLLVGGAIALVGLLIRAWSAGHIRKNRELAISGPYAYTRNPLYFGTLILGIGFSIAAGVWWLALLFVALFLGIYLPVMRVEAEELTQIFGDDYKEYARRVPLLFPSLRARFDSDINFDRTLYLRYREYRAALGFLGAMAILAAKSLFL